MSPRYLYALLDAPPAAPLGTGLAGEPLHIVECDGIFAAAGDMPSPPEPSPEALRGHDAVVRRLASRAHAILPARFRMLTDDDGDLCARLARLPAALREALGRVAGREQMILRVYAVGESRPDQAVREDAPEERAASGTAYLEARARRQRAASGIPELAPLRDVLRRFVAEERIERHDTPPLLASVYHLVPRGVAADYAAAIEDAARALRDVRVRVSGPWAPYAFAPELG